MKNSGSWFFLSYSNLDYSKVRRIRDFLEDLGHHPLMFYLKCLSDEDEIQELIKREIDVREWFIYCDSENASKSNWVKTEREYVKIQGKNRIFKLNLEEDLDH